MNNRRVESRASRRMPELKRGGLADQRERRAFRRGLAFGWAIAWLGAFLAMASAGVCQ